MSTSSWNKMIYFIYIYIFECLVLVFLEMLLLLHQNSDLGFCMINTRTGYIEASLIISVYVYISRLFIVMLSDTTLKAQSCRWSVHLMLGSRKYLTRFCVWSSCCSGLSIISLHSLPRSFETKSERKFLNVYFINYGMIKTMYIFNIAIPNSRKINFNFKNIPPLQLIRSVKKLCIFSSSAKSYYHKIKRYFSNSTWLCSTILNRGSPAQ
jgi:hypothetical protein